MRTLFVCTGNMCRSPLAERLGRHYYPQFAWESAGVMPQGWMHPMSRAVLREIGASDGDFMARQVRELDLGSYTHLVLIGEPARLHTPQNPAHVQRLYWDVPDPYGMGSTREEELNIYRECAADLLQRMEQLIRAPESLR
jgi:protein-tyrosine-phosphatase